jgi:hypothetical protein
MACASCNAEKKSARGLHTTELGGQSKLSGNTHGAIILKMAIALATCRRQWPTALRFQTHQEMPSSFFRTIYTCYFDNASDPEQTWIEHQCFRKETTLTMRTGQKISPLNLDTTWRSYQAHPMAHRTSCAHHCRIPVGVQQEEATAADEVQTNSASSGR